MRQFIGGLPLKDRIKHLISPDKDPMLALRPNCECCDKDLPPQSLDARICSFECTFCAACAEGVLADTCPNCGGELVRRPRRPAGKLVNAPASTERVVKSGGCGAKLSAPKAG